MRYKMFGSNFDTGRTLDIQTGINLPKNKNTTQVGLERSKIIGSLACLAVKLAWKNKFINPTKAILCAGTGKTPTEDSNMDESARTLLRFKALLQKQVKGTALTQEERRDLKLGRKVLAGLREKQLKAATIVAQRRR